MAPAMQDTCNKNLGLLPRTRIISLEWAFQNWRRGLRRARHSHCLCWGSFLRTSGPTFCAYAARSLTPLPFLSPHHLDWNAGSFIRSKSPSAAAQIFLILACRADCRLCSGCPGHDLWLAELHELLRVTPLTLPQQHGDRSKAPDGSMLRGFPLIF